MKKLIAGSLMASMLIVPAMAQDVSVYLNNERMIFDQNPIIENGRTLVPLRSIFESLGAEVKWNPDIQEIKGITSDKEVVLRVGETSATVNGNTVTLDVPAKIENGRTLVPLRFISESLDAEVKWNAEEYRIDIIDENAVDLDLLKLKEFCRKAKEIDEYAENNDDLYTTYEITSYYATLRDKWDELLNEVYQYLRRTMDNKTFEILKKDEIEWIKNKEGSGKSARDEWEGGSIAGSMGNATEANCTKERCIYLISLIKNDDVVDKGYYDILTSVNNIYEFSFYDINKDGNKELIIKVGTCEADYMYYFYTSKNGKAEKIGEEAGGHAHLVGENDGLIILCGHMGDTWLYYITYDGKINSQRETGGDFPKVEIDMYSFDTDWMWINVSKEKHEINNDVSADKDVLYDYEIDNDIKIEYKLFEETIKDDKTGQELLVIEYKYPQFEEKNELLKSLNKKYNDNVDLLLKEKEKIIKYAQNYNEKTNGTGALPFRIYNDIEVTYNNNNIISIVNMLSDWWGEEFPVDAYDYNTENYNIVTGKELILKDIMTNKSQEEIENMLNKKFEEEYNMEIDMSYVKFYLTDNGIMYNYNGHYEVGPYEF